MHEEFVSLKTKFNKIRDIGWIKEKQKGLGAGGYTFERLLNKEEDDLPVPDYHDIEIKVMNDNTKTNLHLFNLVPDGDYLYPIKRILYEIGCPGKEDRNERRLYQTFNSIEFKKLVFGRRAKIKVNYEKEKIELIVINSQNEDINIGVSWSFNYIKERLELKLKYLAFVRVSSSIICGEGYYHYHDISFYKLKGFDTFIDLVDKGIIEITFKIGTHKLGPKAGKVYDHGIDFSIRVADIERLFEEVVV